MVAERFGSIAAAEMAECLQRVREQPSELLVGEWNSLSLIYKKVVHSRRAARRVITSIEQNEKPEGKEQLASHAREYIAEVEGEPQKFRDGILAIMDKNLIPSASTDESKVLYYKMKSDTTDTLPNVQQVMQRARPPRVPVSPMLKPPRPQAETESLSTQWNRLLMSMCRRWWNCRRSFPKTESSSGLWNKSLTFQSRRL